MTTTRLPAIGEVAEDVSRDPGDDILWSVTTIIGVLDKPALIPWAVNETAERTVANLDTVRRRLETEGAESAAEYISKLRWRTDGRLSDKALGTVAHRLFDLYAMVGTRPAVTADLHPDHARKGARLHDDDVRTLTRLLDHFDRFLQTYQPSYDATEVVVYEPRYGYAGQADGFARICDVRLILDYKTSRKTWDSRGRLRKPWPEVALQLSAYRYASCAAVWRARRYSAYSRRYYLLSEAEKAMAVPVPEVDGGVAIYVTPEGLHVYPVRCGPDVYDRFLHCLELARWSFDLSGSVVGNPMTPPFPAPAPDEDPFAGLPE